MSPDSDLYNWLIESIERVAIIRVMEDRKMLTGMCNEAKEFYRKIDIIKTILVLRDFMEKGLALCVNPKERIGRLYELTEKGKRLRKRVLNSAQSF